MILQRKSQANLKELTQRAQVLTQNKDDQSIYETMNQLLKMEQIYSAAIKEVSTKLEILDDEFHINHDHNPIHHMESRLKQPHSIMEKLERIGKIATIENAQTEIYDIAGIRVICNYIDDIYHIADLLLKQDDLKLIRERDYIKYPKANGYRSLHLIVSVPIFLANEVKNVPVEVQIRTIAMDFWASLEHQLRYKGNSSMKDELLLELQQCAESIASVDVKMQSIYQQIKVD